jgi:L-asparaginase II
MEALLAEYVRGGLVESKHFGHLICLSSDGEAVLVKGDPDALIYPRSAFKSIQASAMVRHGLVQEIRHLALVCASHSGTKAQQEGARAILQSAGLDESALRCVADRPLGVLERKEWGDKAPAPIAMNCSGKHAGMLATCVVNGWPTQTYTDMNHPLQIAIKKELEDLSGEKITQISVDGCGAPTFALTLRGNAQMFHNLAKSEDPIHKQVVAACLAYPEIVAGIGRTDTDLMQKVPGLFLKGGAEGVQAAFMVDGRTVFFKVIDGADRAHQVILQAAFEKLGVKIEVNRPEVLGGGKPVGEIRAAL